jgi:hypothetical protein
MDGDIIVVYLFRRLHTAHATHTRTTTEHRKGNTRKKDEAKIVTSSGDDFASSGEAKLNINFKYFKNQKSTTGGF